MPALKTASITDQNFLDPKTGKPSPSAIMAIKQDLQSLQRMIVAVESGDDYTPTVAGLTTAGTFTYTSREFYHYRIGKIRMVTFTIVIDSVSVAGAGEVTVSIPSTIADRTNGFIYAAAYTDGVSWGVGATAPVWRGVANEARVRLRGLANNGAVTLSDASTIAAGTVLAGTLIYEEA